MTRKRACVLVLGDIGRSPRMQYHSLSLINKGYDVDLIGYDESELPPQLAQSDSCKVHGLTPIPTVFTIFPRSFSLILKVLWQSCNLLFKLICLDQPSVVLVQNPPSVPTLPVVWMYCTMRNIIWIIDWHNYGYSILALNSSPFLVKIYKNVEVFYGSKASLHLCVTRALANHLLQNYGIHATTFYDQPSSKFQPLTQDQKRDVFSSLAFYKGFTEFEEFVETSDDGSQFLRKDRPVLLLSSTSWTEDEDFSILLKSLQVYDLDEATPRMLCVITGKGPMKDYYRAVIEKNPLKKVRFSMPWLDPKDYPLVVACADLGVCLHTSSSGLDLPMKVVDMFGTYLPVCAYRYDTLSELVEDNLNGLHFTDSNQLSRQLIQLFAGYPEPSDKLVEFRKYLEKRYKESRWNKSWDEIVAPFFE